MDFITDLPPSEGNTSCLVITDRLSKGVIFEPLKSLSADNVAKKFFEIFYRRHGIPTAITSDRGTQWVNLMWKRVCELIGITRRLSTAYHPETDGSTERVNQELEHFVRVYTTYSQDNWAALMPSAELSYNNKNSASTGFSSFFLEHGYNLEPIELTEEITNQSKRTSPIALGEKMVKQLQDARELAQAAMAVAQQSQEEITNRFRDPSCKYRIGDKVWLNLKNISTDRPKKKFDWIHGKYTITKVIGSHTYELNTPPGIHNRFHTTLLRPVATDPHPSQMTDDPQPPAITGEDGETEYAVEEILQARTKRIGRGTRREVLVKWVGYNKPTWEPLTALLETAAMENFESKYGNIRTNDGPAGEGGNVTS